MTVFPPSAAEDLEERAELALSNFQASRVFFADPAAPGFANPRNLLQATQNLLEKATDSVFWDLCSEVVHGSREGLEGS